MHPNVIHNPPLQRGLALSLVLHLLVGLVFVIGFSREEKKRTELVDIEVAPPPPPVEALPEEVARRPEAAPTPAASTEASSAPEPTGDIAVDAGVDAPIDAAPKKKRRPDAGVDAGEPMGEGDAGVDVDAGPDDGGTSDAELVAAATGSGSGVGSGEAPGRGSQDGAGSGSAGATNEPAVEGAPTTAGTAANLLSYFPAGHVVTAMIRFDRLRDTEWAAPAERLLRPMPDYQIMFGPNDAEIGKKLDTLIISSPSPKDATATTLVAHTKMPRDKLREFLTAASPVTWSASQGGLLGKRTGKLLPNDKRVLLSPFKEWFLLAQPADLGAIGAVTGDLDKVEAKGKQPPWLAGIRTIEAESGDPRGPALVLTLALGGQTVPLGDNAMGLGIKSVTLPERVSLAMELVKQGWLVRGNMSFVSEDAAAAFITAAEGAKQQIANNRGLQLAMGKPVARVIANLRFARTDARVSYTTSISIADARTILAAAAAQLDAYFVTP